MINNPYKIARDAIMLRCDFTIEDVKKPRSEHNPFKPGKILKKFNADLAKQINIFRKIKKLTKDQILEGCESPEFQNVFLEKEEDEILELIDKCELTKYKTIEKLFDFSERFEIKTLDAFAVFSGYFGWADMDFNERFSFREIRESEKQNKVDNSISQEVQEIQLGIGELKQIVQDIQENETKIIPKELTVNLPRIRANQIIGRQKEIEDVRKRLFDNNEVVLVNGMAGIGKTTVGAVYATENSSFYKHIAWISQISSDFVTDFINTPGLLENLKIVKEDKTTNQLYSETIMALKSIKDTPCLIIIDNADIGLAKLYSTLPNQPNWHILVTSREEIPYFDLKELGFLNEEDSIKLFKKNYKKTSITDDDIKNIVKEMDYHTLAIEILAKTANHYRKSPKSVLNAIEDDIHADITIRHSNNKIERVTSYICSIFKLSNLSKNEEWLLVNLACLPPEFHTYKTLKEYIQPEKTKRTDFAKYLSNLTNGGWLLYDKSNDSYKLHRILIEVISKSLNIEIKTIEPLISIITSKLSYETGKDNLADRFGLIAYGKALLKQFQENRSPQIGDIQNNLALVLLYLSGRKNLEEAKQLLIKSIDTAVFCYGENHSTTAIRYSNLAAVFQRLQGSENLLKAKEWYKKSIDSSERNSGEAHHSTAVSYSNLATVLQDLGGKENLIEAIEWLKKSISSAMINFGETHPIASNSYSNLAIVLKELGGETNLMEAKEILKKVIDLDKINLGESDPYLAIGYSNLATVLQDLGDYEEAKGFLYKAKDIAERNFGELHPDTAMYYFNLGDLFHELGEANNLLKAIEWLKKSIDSEKKIFGELHPTIAVRYAKLAHVLRDLGGKQNLMEAKKLLERAKNIAERTLVADHPNTIAIINNLENLNEFLDKE